MDQYNFEEHISAYIDGELSNDDKIEFEKIMKFYPECKAKFNEINDLSISLKSMPKLNVSEDFEADLHRKMNNLRISKISKSSIFERYFSPYEIKPALGLSMSFVFIFMISYVLLNINQSSVVPVAVDSNNENEIYYSDIDSTESNEYEDEIQLTNGSE